MKMALSENLSDLEDFYYDVEETLLSGDLEQTTCTNVFEAENGIGFGMKDETEIDDVLAQRKDGHNLVIDEHTNTAVMQNDGHHLLNDGNPCISNGSFQEGGETVNNNETSDTGGRKKDIYNISDTTSGKRGGGGRVSEGPSSFLSPRIAFSESEMNIQEADMEVRSCAVTTSCSLQEPAVHSKARRSQRKYGAHSKIVPEPVQVSEQTVESSVDLSCRSVLKLPENGATVKFELTEESEGHLSLDEVEKTMKPSEENEGHQSLNGGEKMMNRGHQSLHGGEKALFDISIYGSDGSYSKIRDGTERFAEDLHNGLFSSGETTTLAHVPSEKDFVTEPHNDISVLTDEGEVARGTSTSGNVTEHGSRASDHDDRSESVKKTVMVNCLARSKRPHGREDYSMPKESVEIQSEVEGMPEESGGQQKEAYRIAEEGFEQQRHILFWFAGIVIHAVGFQLKLMWQVLGTMMWLFHYSYVFVSDPRDKILQGKAKVTETHTWMLVHITDLGLATRRGLFRMQPMLTTGARRMGCGCLAATYVFIVLSVLFIFTFFLNFFIVKSCVHEPIQIKDALHFDYTQPRPVASVNLLPANLKASAKLKGMTLPASNMFHVTVLLMLPESDYNRQLGIFQVTAELLSVTGEVLSKSSQPCMLRFKSTLILHIKSVLMAIPLLAGFSSETQTLVLPLLEWQESKNSPSMLVRIFLEPRAGCSAGTGLPELYEAEIRVASELPWMMSTVQSWRWTLYVWIGMSFYVVEVAIVLCLCRQILLPKVWSGHTDSVGAMQSGLGMGSQAESSRPNSGHRRQVSFQDECSSTLPNGTEKG